MEREDKVCEPALFPLRPPPAHPRDLSTLFTALPVSPFGYQAPSFLPLTKQKRSNRALLQFLPSAAHLLGYCFRPAALTQLLLSLPHPNGQSEQRRSATASRTWSPAATTKGRGVLLACYASWRRAASQWVGKKPKLVVWVVELGGEGGRFWWVASTR